MTLATLVLLFMTGAMSAQVHPDFSGTWAPIVVAPPAESSGGVAALAPSDLVIKQSADTIALSRTAFDRVTTTTYTFDGKDSTNKSGAVTRVTRSRWSGTSLVTEGKASQVTSQGYAAWTMKETVSIDRQGHLVIANESTSDDGVVTRGSLSYSKKAAR